MSDNRVANASFAKEKPAVRTKRQPSKIKDWITAYKPVIAAALPSVMTPDRFTRICLSAVSANPELAACTPESFLGAMLNAAQLGLEPNSPLGHAYLIPYKNYKKNGQLECQFQIGYKGLIDLAYRSGDVSSIEARTVYENDYFEFEYGLNSNIVHRPTLANRGKAVAYYAVYKNTSGFSTFMVMGRDEVESFAKAKSKAFKSGSWQTDFDAMAKKTVLKALLKYAPLKAEFASGITQDATVKSIPKSVDENLEFATIQNELVEEAEYSEHELVAENEKTEE